MGIQKRHGRSRFPALLSFALLGLPAALTAGCGKDSKPVNEAVNCAPDELPSGQASTSGSARLFFPDPIVSSRRASLAPSSLDLDQFATEAPLERLGGHGVLEGAYVDVRNGISCDGWFGAYDTANAFAYPHSDARFQEAMSYSWGDRYRSALDAAGALPAARPLKVIAHCRKEDNAFFVRGTDSAGRKVELVCLGDSVATQGASYADDATVTIHELQHATTTSTYSANEPLNQFFYDEAGALNEAVSDFMALMFEQPLVAAAGFDTRLFSRWALGTFIPGSTGFRGAHKCPAYDSAYPACGSFPAFSGSGNNVSYVYPDGLGWPYADNYPGPGKVANAFGSYKGQEQIHNASVLMSGAMWDVYEAIKAGRGGDHAQAWALSTQVVHEALVTLPKPTAGSGSPVTFRRMAEEMVDAGPSVGLSGADQAAMVAALTARGLVGGTLVDSSWAAVGPGNAGITPGLRVQDNPAVLKTWLTQMTEDASAGLLVPQGSATGLNGKLDRNELVAIWFDLRNTGAQTAGGVELTVTSLDPAVTFELLDRDQDTGRVRFVSRALAQVRYGKVNGTAIVSSLASGNATYHVNTGNSYFRTNPFYDRGFTTALWVRVGSSAAAGSTARFRVDARPSNGSVSTAEFTATIL